MSKENWQHIFGLLNSNLRKLYEISSELPEEREKEERFKKYGSDAYGNFVFSKKEREMIQELISITASREGLLSLERLG